METPACPLCHLNGDVHQTGSKSIYEYLQQSDEQDPVLASEERVRFWKCSHCGGAFETESEGLSVSAINLEIW